MVVSGRSSKNMILGRQLVSKEDVACFEILIRKSKSGLSEVQAYIDSKRWGYMGA